ncbi:FAD-binding oxidoreductase [Antrihabitans stalactiti]|uniref:FAD-binding oxidoreductase n=1 Tax=Antrihabitans stalactiti TaxID=2584121 RepID=A0A848KMI4_9NOCA|nr:FAD-binding protein [Antrihabitans stalactiti]NMN99441.1 FAD-binding oxidoreductase [Antrihabitans stalactiti]
MPALSRRRLLVGAAALAGAAITFGRPSSANAVPGLEVVGPSNPQFGALAGRGFNKRFAATPDRIFLPTTTDEVVDAVGRSVEEGLRIAARSGGHGFEDFVANPEVKAIVDLSRLAEVRYDDAHRAISVGAGADLGTVYERLYRGWGVTIPGGSCLGVGIGGHATGGGYGPLSRLFGTVVDHIYGVEVVVVDARGKASAVVATRDGPNADLWWAHTGGGGGNFGVVTRFLLRSHDSDGSDPARLLPVPPATLSSATIVLPSADENSFVTFVGNYLRFYERHNEPGSRFASLDAPLSITPRTAGFAMLTTQIDATLPNAGALFAEFVAALGEGVSPPPVVVPGNSGPFLDMTLALATPRLTDTARSKYKAAYLRKPYSEDQLRAIHRHLARFDPTDESGLQFLPFGGAVNSRAAGATAMPTRDAFMKMLYVAAWRNPADDDRYLALARNFYGELYSSSGGVPVRNDVSSGSYINYPDTDLADPRWNASGMPWQALYYGDNYARLQQIKSKWDPANTFRHRLSIEPKAI